MLQDDWKRGTNIGLGRMKFRSVCSEVWVVRCLKGVRLLSLVVREKDSMIECRLG